jgi:hypothetical protein
MSSNNTSVNLENFTIKELKELTKDPNTPTDILKQIYWVFKDWRVLVDIAEHPNATQYVLNFLATEDDPFVRAAVAESPRCTPVILSFLSHDKTSLVRSRVWRNPNTNEEDLVMIKAMRWIKKQ